jgi:hypothetical protein
LEFEKEIVQVIELAILNIKVFNWINNSKKGLKLVVKT